MELRLPDDTERAAAARGFSFTSHVRRLCCDLAARLPELAHIDMAHVAIRYCQVRQRGLHGIQASLTPLRFDGGAIETVRRGRRWRVQPIRDASGREMLYLLSFYLPRFLNHSLEEKLATVVHELWHIGPAFDGDLRRHAGRRYAHGGSEEAFHDHARQLARRWRDLEPPAETFEFLRYNFAELQERYGNVYGLRIPTPKLLLVAEAT